MHLLSTNRDRRRLTTTTLDLLLLHVLAMAGLNGAAASKRNRIPMTDSTTRWWTSLSDECPITLEPLSTLPYPPFCLGGSSSSGTTTAGTSSTSSTSTSTSSDNAMYFDGLALASYVVSRGNFQNPLTREELAWDDCVRLDDYLVEYCYGGNRKGSSASGIDTVIGGGGSTSRGGRISVKEAYGLRGMVKVGRGGQQAQHNDADQRRAEALRSEAAAALRGLFVYGNDRRGRGAALATSSALYSEYVASGARHGEIVPAAGFALHRLRTGNGIEDYDNNNHQQEEYDANGEVVLSEVEGLRIIDDDAAVARGSDDAAWRDVQEAFPRLDGANAREGNEDCIDDNPRQSELLQRAREVAAQTRRKEEETRLIKERGRQILIEDAMRRRMERRKQREEEIAKQAIAMKAKQAENMETERAKSEIEQWREQQWRLLARMAEQARQSVSKEQKKEATASESTITASISSTRSDTVLEPDEASIAAAKEERQAAKKAAKKKKERERQKAKKAAERKERERLAKIEEEAKKRAEAKLRCAQCTKGILDGGFEKFGAVFCSTNCARAGVT